MVILLHFFNGQASDEEENEDKVPSWEKQASMVRRLQKKFPDQDKEVSERRLKFTMSQLPFPLM